MALTVRGDRRLKLIQATACPRLGLPVALALVLELDPQRQGKASVRVSCAR